MHPIISFIESKYSLLAVFGPEIKYVQKFRSCSQQQYQPFQVQGDAWISQRTKIQTTPLTFVTHQKCRCIRASYDLTNLNMAAQIERKRNSTSLSPRFKYQKSYNPSPSDYKRKSFIEESKDMGRGPKLFTHDRMKENRLSTSPGPGQYSPALLSTTP